MDKKFSQLFEINMNNARKDSDSLANTKLNGKSPIVEIFSAVAGGQDLTKYGDKVDKVMGRIKQLGELCQAGDVHAKAELNTIVRYAIEPLLLQKVNLFGFMGTYRAIGFDEQPRVRTYKHESIRSNFQASQGDVPFATTTWEEYVIDTQTISSGYAFNYREIASGNLDKVQEGMEQVQIDMLNKSVAYVVAVLYNAIKNATGVKYFAEVAGLTKTAVDTVLKKVRRFGQPNIVGDYSIVSQLNGFQGFKIDPSDAKATALSRVIMEEIQRTGLVSSYMGSNVVELPNAYNLTKLNSEGDNFSLYMPEGLLFFIPQGAPQMRSALQVFRRGGLQSLSGVDIISGQEMTRFDLEIGADVARGREFEIGLVSDSTFDAPATDGNLNNRNDAVSVL